MPDGNSIRALSNTSAGKSALAQDDTYSLATNFLVIPEDATGAGIFEIDALDLLANDRGGSAKAIHGLGDGVDTLQSSHGGLLTISGGTLTYDTNGKFDFLPSGQSLEDTFTYSIRLGKGVTSSATVTVLIQGANDPAQFFGQEVGAVAEDGVLTAAGKLTVTDIDEGEASFRVHDAPNPIAGNFGFLTIDATGNWNYTLDNSDPQVQALSAGQSLSDTMTIESLDGTPTQIVITISGANERDPGVYLEGGPQGSGWYHYITSADQDFEGHDSARDFYIFDAHITPSEVLSRTSLVYAGMHPLAPVTAGHDTVDFYEARLDQIILSNSSFFIPGSSSASGFQPTWSKVSLDPIPPGDSSELDLTFELFLPATRQTSPVLQPWNYTHHVVEEIGTIDLQHISWFLI